MSQFIADRMWPDARVEESIFGTRDPEQIWRRVCEVCPGSVACFAFEASVGVLVGVEMGDGSRVAVKFHRDAVPADLAWYQRVQEHVWRSGFPCPRPLGCRGGATLEEWVDDGEYRDAHDSRVRRVVAKSLSSLVELTRGLVEPERHYPRLQLWPTPHNVLFDFDATAAGAEWIDDIAASAKPLKDAGVGRLVIGHGDWSVKHFRFDGLKPTVVYDWDSLNTDYEPVFVGVAAATFTYTEHLPVDRWATVDEARAFVADYEAARAEPFTAEERRAVGATATYSRAYGARCVNAVGGDARQLQLPEYARAFL